MICEGDGDAPERQTRLYVEAGGRGTKRLDWDAMKDMPDREFRGV